MEGYVPYGWQFRDEDVFVPSERSKGLNCFGLLSRSNDFYFKTSMSNIDSDFIIEFFENFSRHLKRMTVVVLDNARVHTSKKVQACRDFWAQRCLYLFFLPAYSPHLNIIEILWHELKCRWLRGDDYGCEQGLFYQVTLALGAVGNLLRINFAPFVLV
jgi:transposase